MKFVISSANLKIFAKSILALYKVGDEVYVEPLEESLTLRTVNSSRSAFACFSFKNTFFTHFEPELVNNKLSNSISRLNDKTANRSTVKNKENTEKDDTDSEDTQLDQVEPFKCKIPSKCLFTIFKNINSLEKNVEKCTITVKYIPLSQETASRVYEFDTTTTSKRINERSQEQLFDIKFLIILSCKHNIRKTFILSISDCENLQAAFSTRNCSNKLNISAKYLNETINCFSNDIEEVSFVVEANKLSIKNYEAQNVENNTAVVNTQVSFDSDEFTLYEIDKETDITFCLKEFKIGLQFGFYFDLALDIFFQRKGRPIIFSYNSNTSYEAIFTLATLTEDYSTQNSSTLVSSNLNTSIARSATTNENDASNKNEHKNTQLDKDKPGNKRSLIDSSNIHLDESMNAHQKSKKKVQIQDSDDDDALLTQALDAQEARNATIQKSPPAKKMRSLVQSIFADEEEETMNENQHQITKKITFAACLDDSNPDENTRTSNEKKTSAIYIEETSSEEEHD